MDPGTCIKQLIAKGTEEFIMPNSNSPAMHGFLLMSLLSPYQNMQLKSICPTE